MAKFSEAPWSPTPGQIPPESIWSADGQTRICRLSDRYDDGAKDDETLLANARLIAAAPELLAALITYQNAIRAGRDPDKTMIENAGNAIAKAMIP